MLNSLDLLKKYGEPCDTKNHTVITLPFPMRVAWDLNTSVRKITVHKLIAQNMLGAFNDIFAHYGYDKIKELGIDLFGGVYNCRKMRGGTTMSKHAWAVAIDIDPARNTLHETHKTARFARPEYKPMIDAFYKNGFISLGREKDYDWMHFEIAK